MKKRSLPLILVLAAVTAFALSACSSQPPAPEQKAAGVEDRTAVPVSSPAPSVQPVAPDAKVEDTGLAVLKDPKNILAKRSVFFDYDSFVVKGEFQALLEAHGKFLVGHPALRVLIQGNADERGSREYNLALGQKRAEAVKKRLLVLGAKEDQVESVSLGKEKPRCGDSTETCWAQNRRSDILYSGEF
jgi:peptidoglycan-associated lipoprotein